MQNGNPEGERLVLEATRKSGEKVELFGDIQHYLDKREEGKVPIVKYSLGLTEKGYKLLADFHSGEDGKYTIKDPWGGLFIFESRDELVGYIKDFFTLQSRKNSTMPSEPHTVDEYQKILSVSQQRILQTMIETADPSQKKVAEVLKLATSTVAEGVSNIVDVLARRGIVRPPVMIGKLVSWAVDNQEIIVSPNLESNLDWLMVREMIGDRNLMIVLDWSNGASKRKLAALFGVDESTITRMKGRIRRGIQVLEELPNPLADSEIFAYFDNNNLIPSLESLVSDRRKVASRRKY